MDYLPCKNRCTYNMDINKCNTQECNLNNCGIKVDDILAVEKKQTCLGCFFVWTVYIKCSKKFNHNQGAKAKAHFEGHEDKQDDDTDLSFNFDDDYNNNQEQLFLKNKADITDSKFNKGSKQFFKMKLNMNLVVLEV